MKPHVIYKMRRDFTPSAAEKARYHPGVIVSFQPCGVIDQGVGDPAADTEWMLDNYVRNWAKVHHTGRRLLVYDSAAAHLTPAVKEAIAQTDTSLAIIPGGLTSVLQTLAQGTDNPAADTDFIFVYRHHYQRIAFEWADKNPDVKLTAETRRILGTHFTAQAYEAALERVDIARSFSNRGYVWPTDDGSHIKLRELPSYSYDPFAPLLRLPAPQLASSSAPPAGQTPKKQRQATLDGFRR